MEKEAKFIGYASFSYNIDRMEEANKRLVLKDQERLGEIEEILKNFGKLVKIEENSWYPENIFHLERNSHKMRIAYCNEMFEISVLKTENWEDVTRKYKKSFYLCRYSKYMIKIDNLEDSLTNFFRLFKRTPSKREIEKKEKFYKNIYENRDCENCKCNHTDNEGYYNKIRDGCSETEEECKYFHKQYYNYKDHKTIN